MEKRVDELLKAIDAGTPGAEDELFQMVYEDLRRIASRQLGGGRGSPTIGTTALVHETYLKLVDRSSTSARDRGHFFAIAARAMRHIVVDYVRGKRAEKRGGGAPAIDLGDAEELLSDGAHPSTQLDILAVDRALDQLNAKNPRLREVVELRFFGGFGVEETADILGSSPRTVKRDWQLARAFLFRALRDEPSDG